MRNPRKEKERRFVDVAPVKKNKALFLKERVFRFELNFSRLWLWIRENRLLAGVSALASFVLIVGFFGFLIRAQVVTLTPSSCLGGWTNPAYAEGFPDATQRENSSYTQENSAVLYNKISEIFCGDFSGDISENTLPTRVTLSFSLAMKSKSEFFAEPILEETNGTSTEAIINTTSTLPESALEEKIIEETPKEIKKEEILPPPIQNSSSSEEGSPSAWFFRIFARVFAQEENTPLPETQTEPISESQNGEIPPSETLQESASGTITSSSLTETIQENASGTASSSEEGGSSEEKKKGLYDFEYDSVVEVVWSTDGGEWQSLGYLNPRNYENAKFTLPIESWESLESVQVALRSVLATDALPAVFLDAVLLDVEFEKTNEIVEDEETELTRIFESLRAEQMPPGFAVQNITFLQGAPRLGVILKFLNNGREELWLIGKRIININGGRTIAKDFPVGIKEQYLFWLDEGKGVVFAYDTRKKIYFEIPLPPPLLEETEKRRVIFSEIPWEVIVAPDAFYFWSEATGEVFSDGSSLAVDFFNKKFDLEMNLSEEKLGELGIPIPPKENDETISE